MYDFPLEEISEPVKTIAWLLQNKPERFCLREVAETSLNPYSQVEVMDSKTCKTFVVQHGWLYGNIATVMEQDWMTPVEKMYLAQEVLALVSRNRKKVLDEEKERWLRVYQGDISGQLAVSEAESEPVNVVQYELSPLEKAAKEHTAKLLSEEVRKQDLKSIKRVIVVGALALLVPLVYLLLSK